VFTRIGWAVTWLFAPLAGLAMFGVAIFATLTGYDELAPAVLMACCALVMWLVLIWAVARLLPGKVRAVYLGGCAAFAIVALAASYLPTVEGPDETTVDLIQPPKAR
jgi:hypothetical protein